MDDPAIREEFLSRAKRGDRKAREELIEHHRHFVLRTARACCRQNVGWSDDVASMALIAFDEAIDAYDSGRGVPFPAFARIVIRSRITDHLRKEARETNGFSIDELDHVNGSSSIKIAHVRFSEDEVIRERREEIERYAKLLSEFGLSFRELTKAAPKHRDTRLNLLIVAREMSKNDTLFKVFVEKKRLPINELTLATGVPRKTLERGRRYIVALSLILGYPEDFTYLYSHLKYC
ncbi:MAG: RNA polymerase sigma factor SigI [Bacillota bacterium]